MQDQCTISDLQQYLFNGFYALASALVPQLDLRCENASARSLPAAPPSNAPWRRAAPASLARTATAACAWTRRSSCPSPSSSARARVIASPQEHVAATGARAGACCTGAGALCGAGPSPSNVEPGLESRCPRRRLRTLQDSAQVLNRPLKNELIAAPGGPRPPTAGRVPGGGGWP